jgi:hypothetical protein
VANSSLAILYKLFRDIIAFTELKRAQTLSGISITRWWVNNVFAQQCAQPRSLRSLDTPKLRFAVPVSVKRWA